MRTLVLGGVKSGKSSYAESLAVQSRLPVTLIATAQALDEEMAQRIAQHKADRPADWSVLEVPLLLSKALNALNAQNDTETCVIVDCLTLWLTQLYGLNAASSALAEQRTQLVEAVEAFRGDLILVSNEINMGVTPMGELSRVFCDQAGLLHQSLAHTCENVFLVVAGLPHKLK